MQMRLRFLAVALLGVVSPVASYAQDSTSKPLPSAPASTLAGPSPGADIYSEEQAERGRNVFTRACLECHTRKDMSSTDFRINWNGRAVYELFDRLRTTMPDASPGSLTRQEYADVTAYFLKLNGMPVAGMPVSAPAAATDSAPPALAAAATMLDADSTMRSAKIVFPDSAATPATLRTGHR